MANLPGSGLGTARGSIDISLDELRGVQQQVQRISRQIGGHLEQGVGGGAKRAQNQIREMAGPRTIRDLNNLGSSVANLRNLLLVGLVVGAGRAAIGLAELRNQANRSGLAFEILSGGAGNAEARIRAVVTASGDAVTSLEAITIGTQASSLGLATTSAEFARLTRAARAAALVSPVINDIGSAITELGLASANLSFRRLDQLGLSVSEVRERIAELRQETDGLDESQMFLQATVDLLNEKYADLLDSQELNATGFKRLGVAMQETRLEIAQNVGWIDRVAGSIANSLNNLRDQSEALRLVKQGHEGLNPAQQTTLQGIESLIQSTNRFITMGRTEDILLQQLISDFYALAEAQEAAAAGNTFGGTRGRLFQALPGVTGRIQERREAAREEARALADIETDFRESRQQEIEDFARQRAETIRNFERQTAREAEDFARNRLRAEQELERQIAGIQESRLERDAEVRAELAERETSIRKQLNDRILKIQEDFTRAMQRAQDNHRDNLLDAASRLDARAIFEEQRRFRRQEQDLLESRDDQLSQARETANAQLEQARQTATKQLEIQRQNAEDRIAEMRADFARRNMLEDEDRAIRLRRMREDHNAQLQIQGAAHQRSLEEQIKHYNEALAVQLDFQDALVESWKRRAQRLTEQELREGQVAVIPSGGEGANIGVQRGNFAMPQQFQGGGLVRRTGMALVHAGEMVASRTNAQMAAAMAQMGGGMGGVTVNGGINIPIYAQPGQDAGALADAVEERLVDIFRRLGGA